jgi:tRNA pseudouridine38-40 synthase
MPILIINIEYDGTNYGGWQIQPNAITIQGKIESALFELSGQILNLVGAGRTDAGVHASGMIAHTEINPDFKIPENKIAQALNALLPNDIFIKNVKITDKSFHARFDAIAREYIYSIHTIQSVFKNRYSVFIPYKLNKKILFESARIFIGSHDFTAFSKNNPDTKSHICNVNICEWIEISQFSYTLKIKSDRFVYGMVRSLTGAMIDAARGKKTTNNLRLSLESGIRKHISTIAPPQGLVLEKIYYPKTLAFFD